MKSREGILELVERKGREGESEWKRYRERQEEEREREMR